MKELLIVEMVKQCVPCIPAITATTTVESTSFTLGKILSRNEDINERNKSILNTYNLYSL